MFDIVEKFVTLSGEAPIAGKPVYLVRLTGCNLNCSYCDTVYNDEINYKYSLDELTSDIQKVVNEYPGIFVLFTGGEPLIDGRGQLLSKVASSVKNTTFYVETNGSLKIDDFSNPDLRYVVDWKTPSSGHGNSFLLNNLDVMRPGLDVIKIVVAKEDLGVLIKDIEIIKKINPLIDIYLSPQWDKISLEELSSFIIENKLPVSLSLQFHKIIWGERRGV